MEHKREAMQQYSAIPPARSSPVMARCSLCGFKYDNVRDSDPFLKRFVDTTKEQWSMWILKNTACPGSIGI